VIRVVPDANVLVSAAVARDPAAPRCVRSMPCSTSGSRSSAALCCLARSPRSWGATGFARYLSIDEARRFVTDLAAIMSLVADPPPPHPAVCRDPDDDDLVALARAARVDALVTGDRDLLVLDDIGVAVITPQALVEKLADAR
jgi:predicted nucleic acid-binding protein